MFKNRCYNGGNKHNFQPRYSEKESLFKIKGELLTIDEARKLMYYKVYEKDICKWCGEEIKNEK